MGPDRDESRLLTGRWVHRLRDALVLLASLGVVVAVLASSQQRLQAPVHGAAAASVAQGPPPLPSAAEQAAATEPDNDAGCEFVDRGFGAYERWRALPLGRLLVPPAQALDQRGGYELLVHFHGAEPVRKELAPMDLGLVIAAIDAGARSSAYGRAISGGAWDTLLSSIDREVERATGIAGAHRRHLVLSSWSAGSGAVSRIVAQGAQAFDAVILLDSLYGAYAPGRTALMPGQLADFVALANAAARGGPMLYLTHTAVPTNGYASTAETASFLLQEIGASAFAVNAAADLDELGGSGPAARGGALQLTRMYDGGNLYVRGYAGASRDAHCAQLRLLPAILTERVLPSFGR